MYVNVLPVTDDYSRGECPEFDRLVLKTDKIDSVSKVHVLSKNVTVYV